MSLMRSSFLVVGILTLASFAHATNIKSGTYTSSNCVLKVQPGRNHGTTLVELSLRDSSLGDQMEILADNRIDFGPSICTVPEEVGFEAAKSVMAIETPLSTRGKLISISCGSQAIQVQVQMVTSADGT